MHAHGNMDCRSIPWGCVCILKDPALDRAQRETHSRKSRVDFLKGALAVAGAEGGGGGRARGRAATGPPLAVPELRRLPALLPCALQKGRKLPPDGRRCQSQERCAPQH